MNLCNIYQFAADKVTSNMTVKHNTCSFHNKCCEKLWIAVYNQSATVTYIPVHHYKTIPRCTTLPRSCYKTNQSSVRHRCSTFQRQTMAYCVLPVTPSTDPQRSSVHINNIETRTTINDIIAPDEYQALLWSPHWVCLGFLLK